MNPKLRAFLSRIFVFALLDMSPSVALNDM